MRARLLLAMASIGVMAFVALYVAASVGFCIDSSDGRIGGCAAIIGGDALRSTMIQVFTVASVAGLLLAQGIRRRR